MLKSYKLSVFVVTIVFSLLVWWGMGLAQEKPFAGITLNVLMESISDTDVVEQVLPEFEKETGIKVEIEAVEYMTMHDKLIPQLLAPEKSGTYDFLIVDNYWIGEFVAGGWLIPLDDLIARTPSINFDNYIPSLISQFAQIGGVTYMLPFWPYPHGIVYRTDIIESPEFQKAYKERFGRNWREPQSIEEYAEVAKLAGKVTPPEVYGAAMQAARIDPIVMEWLDFLYSMGGDIYDRTTWECIINNEAGIKAAELYMGLLEEAAQPGVTGADFNERAILFEQGKAAFNIVHVPQMIEYRDPKISQVYDKIKLIPVPKSGLLGCWLWGIQKSSPHPEAAWEFISWVESREIAYKRAMIGAMPAQGWIYEDPAFLEKNPWQTYTGKMIAMQKSVPNVSRSTQVVEIIGENMSAYVIGEISSAREALDKAAKDLTKLIQGDPMLKFLKK